MSFSDKQVKEIVVAYLITWPNDTVRSLFKALKKDYKGLGLTSKALEARISLERKLLKNPNFIPKLKPAKVIKPKGHFTVVIGCTHIPFHNKKQFDATARLTNWLSSRVTTDFVADGDILDMNSISRHNKGKVAKQPGLTLGEEYRLANVEFDKFDWSSIRHKTYLYGNHEVWYYAHMAEVDNAKLGEGAVKSPKEALKLEDKGFNVLVNYGQDTHHIGDLLVVHGYLVNKHSAMAHLEVYKENVLFFHTHRNQTYTDSGPNNTQITAYNAGFGGQREMVAFNYMDEGSKRKWKNGIAVTYTNELGHTTVDLLDWKDERFLYMGHQFTADGVTLLI